MIEFRDARQASRVDLVLAAFAEFVEQPNPSECLASIPRCGAAEWKNIDADAPLAMEFSIFARQRCGVKSADPLPWDEVV